MFAALTHVFLSGHKQYLKAMIVYSTACLGRVLKHLSASTGATVQKSPGREVWLGWAWDEKKTPLSCSFSNSSWQFALHELLSNSDAKAPLLSLAEGRLWAWSVPLGLHTQLCGGWDHGLPSVSPRVALRHHLLGIPETTDGLTKKAKASQCSLSVVSICSCTIHTFPQSFFWELKILCTRRSRLLIPRSFNRTKSPSWENTHLQKVITSSKHLATSSAPRSSWQHAEQ